jgi:hypothetical protein
MLGSRLIDSENNDYNRTAEYDAISAFFLAAERFDFFEDQSPCILPARFYA